MFVDSETLEGWRDLVVFEGYQDIELRIGKLERSRHKEAATVSYNLVTLPEHHL